MIEPRLVMQAAVRQWVTDHPKCTFPGWWERRRRGIVNGAEATCPICGIVATFNKMGAFMNFWTPEGPLNRAKDHAIRGETVMVGMLPMAWVDAYLMTDEERMEVQAFQRKWLREEVR